jgi:integrase
MRSTRRGVKDRWLRRDGQPSTRHGVGKRWRARYVDDHGREHSAMFDTKKAAGVWLDKQTTALGTGTHVAPKDARLTVSQWCATWLDAYAVNRASTVRQARVHVKQIEAEVGHLPLSSLRPSQVKTWVAKLQADGLADSYIYALHSRLAQVLADAVHDGLLGRNPCSRKTSPPMGKPKVYVATTEQVWALHDAMPEHLRVAVLLGAFAGLRVSEAAALRVSDVDFIRGIVTPARQWPDAPLKTNGSAAPIPIPSELALMLSASVAEFGGEMMVPNGQPWLIERAVRDAREKVEGLPETFTYHDLRHYYASALIASGVSIKTLQARMRHASARTSLDTYGHLMPDADESTRAAIGAAIGDRLTGSRATG